MAVKSVQRTGNKISLNIEIDLDGSLFEMEEAIEKAVNEVGSIATQQAIERFDTDGSVIKTGNILWWSKGKVNQKYQTPYGTVDVMRHLYQNKDGGRTFCPLEQEGRIILTSTPKFAKSISSKYTSFGAGHVARDFEENHGRKVSSTYVKSIADVVGMVAQAKEESWEYTPPELDESVATVAVSMDGTCMLTCDTGWRETMVGCLSLYNAGGDRMHSIYLGATPEYGKATFLDRFDRELDHLKRLYPEALFVGLADGAKSNWKHLTPLTDDQVLDFWHVSEYVAEAASMLYPTESQKAEKEKWLEDRLHKLKHDPDGVEGLLADLKARRSELRKKADRGNMAKVLKYISNNKGRMRYSHYLAAGIPIGSGVCEAACKTLVKQRLCGSGMRWKESGASSVISLRAIKMTSDRWSQFWQKIINFGM